MVCFSLSIGVLGFSLIHIHSVVFFFPQKFVFFLPFGLARAQEATMAELRRNVEKDRGELGVATGLDTR